MIQVSSADRNGQLGLEIVQRAVMKGAGFDGTGRV
jgi:hypothetical protein